MLFFENIFKNNPIGFSSDLTEKDKERISKCKHHWVNIGTEAWGGIYKASMMKCLNCKAEKYTNQGKIY